MPNIYFTADTHFYHKNIIKYCNRPFDTYEEMNKAIVERWNSIVEEDDTIYHLGDVTFRYNYQELEVVRRLKGKKFLIPGNHDQQKVINKLSHTFTVLPETHILEDLKVVLYHCPLEDWYKKDEGFILLHGHSHGGSKKEKGRLDVGVDVHNYTPISLEYCWRLLNNDV